MDALTTIKTRCSTIIGSASTRTASPSSKQWCSPFLVSYKYATTSPRLPSAIIILIESCTGLAAIAAPIDAVDDGIHGRIGSPTKSLIDGYAAIDAGDDAHDAKHDDHVATARVDTGRGSGSSTASVTCQSVVIEASKQPNGQHVFRFIQDSSKQWAIVIVPSAIASVALRTTPSIIWRRASIQRYVSTAAVVWWKQHIRISLIATATIVVPLQQPL
jgi:hypothetical protein